MRSGKHDGGADRRSAISWPPRSVCRTDVSTSCSSRRDLHRHLRACNIDDARPTHPSAARSAPPVVVRDPVRTIGDHPRTTSRNRRDESARTSSLDDIARRVASSRRQLQRAYAEIGNTTFREHLTRGAHGARRRAADEPRHSRPRGRTPGRLPPARPVREGVPAPSRRGAVGLPLDASLHARGRSRALRGRLAPLRRRWSAAAGHPRCRPSARIRILPGPWRRRRPRGRGPERRPPRRFARRGRPPVAQMIVIGAIASALGIALGLHHQLVPDAGVDAGREDRHALRRPDHRLGAGVRPRDGRRPLLRVEVPHAAGRGARGRAADPRQHAPRGDLDRDPGDRPRRLCTYAYVTLTTSRRPPAGEQQDQRLRPAVRLDVRVPAGRRQEAVAVATSSTSRRTGRCGSS